MSKTKNLKAFTLVEILIVIAILAILAVVTFVVINPAQRINQANDSQTRQNVTAVCDAMSLYVADVYSLPQYDSTPTSTATPTDLPTVDESTVYTAGVDASDLIGIQGTYLPEIPTEADGDQIQVGQNAGAATCAGELTDGTFFAVTR